MDLALLLPHLLVTTMLNAGARFVSLSRCHLLELYVFRKALEGMIRRLAATNMPDDVIVELPELFDYHESEVWRTKGAEYFQREGDLDFRFRIAKGCQGELLRSAVCGDHYQLMRIHRYKHSHLAGRPERALKKHRQILDAIRDRDGGLAELLMRKHVRRARQAFELKVSMTSKEAS